MRFFNSGLALVTYILIVVSITACGGVLDIESSLQETVDLIQVQQTGVAGTRAALTQTADFSLNIRNKQTEVVQNNLNSEITLIPSPDDLATEIPEVSGVLEDSELETRIKASKILVFENLSGSRQIRYAKRALDEGGYFYLDVGSATGWFKDQLLSNEDWDLVIVAAEARREFGGEYFEYLHNQAKRGSALVIEFWDIDNAPSGRIKPLLTECGVNFQSDWFDPEMRSIFWLKNDHPLLNIPNQIPIKLREAQPIWRGDKGDLLLIDQAQKGAELVAGTSGLWKEDHGTLASCMDGRMVIQTFSSHEYAMEDMIALWQNYIYNTLKNHHILTYSNTYQPDLDNKDGEASDSGTDLSSADDLATKTSIGEQVVCGPLVIRVPDYPLKTMDMFEHHADGIFLILDLEISNSLQQPVQIWDDDYTLVGLIGAETKVYKQDKAASGYLYIENPVNLTQDLIEPGGVWRTKLAFDVNPQGSDWTLVVKPGDEIGKPICEVKISVSQ